MVVCLHLFEYLLYRFNNRFIFEIAYLLCFYEIVVVIICDDVILVFVKGQHGQRASRVRTYILFLFSFSAKAAKQNTLLFVGTPSEAVPPAAGCMSSSKISYSSN